MKFDHTQVFGFTGAFRGMRNPMNSHDKSDSTICGVDPCQSCPLCDKLNFCGQRNPGDLIIGEKDLALAQKLIRAGSEHRKFMRQIMISVDITAPRYWWSEYDTYKVGTTANSTSTMHKLSSTPITIDCFEMDDFNPDLKFVFELSDEKETTGYRTTYQAFYASIIPVLEGMRKTYLETGDKRHWKELVRALPAGWIQTRTVTLSYENVYTMIHQREHHKLNEWSGIDDAQNPNFISWAKTLPYAKELLFFDREAIAE